jgi:hypothetical protein
MKKYDAATNTYVSVSNTQTEALFTNSGNKAFLTFVSGPKASGNIASGAAPTTLKAVGTLITGTKTVSFTPTGSNDFYLVGNPYACPVDFDKVIANASTSNLKPEFTVVDPSMNTSGAYVTLTKQLGVWVSNNGGSAQNQYLQNGQAAFVQAATLAPADISFEENDKETAASQTNIFRTNGGLTESIRLNLKLVTSSSTANIIDGALITCHQNLSNAIASGEDAPKFFNFNESISIRNGNGKLSIEGRQLYDVGDTLRIGLDGMRQFNFKLEIAPSNMSGSGLAATLYDTYLNTLQPLTLSATGTYTFSVNGDPASASSSRFFIVFSNNTPLDGDYFTIDAAKEDNSVAVSWAISSEENISGFELERSGDGKSFTRVLAIPSEGKKTYNVVDDQPFSGLNYYRVRALRTRGTSLYTAVRIVNMSNNVQQLSAFPNPSAASTIQLHLAGVAAGDYTVNLYNSAGQLILTKQLSTSGSSVTGTLDISKMAAGVYQLALVDKAGNNLATQKLVRQ